MAVSIYFSIDKKPAPIIESEPYSSSEVEIALPDITDSISSQSSSSESSSTPTIKVELQEATGKSSTITTEKAEPADKPVVKKSPLKVDDKYSVEPEPNPNPGNSFNINTPPPKNDYNCNTPNLPVLVLVVITVF